MREKWAITFCSLLFLLVHQRLAITAIPVTSWRFGESDTLEMEPLNLAERALTSDHLAERHLQQESLSISLNLNLSLSLNLSVSLNLSLNLNLNLNLSLSQNKHTLTITITTKDDTNTCQSTETITCDIPTALTNCLAYLMAYTVGGFIGVDRHFDDRADRHRVEVLHDCS